MSADAHGGGAMSPSKSILEEEFETKGLSRILGYIAANSLGDGGALVPEAEAMMRLRSEDTRDETLRKFIVGICPSEVNPEIWLKWIYGGASPFASDKLARVGTDGHSSKKSFIRSADRVKSAEADVEKAEAQLKAAKEALGRTKAFDAALVEWAVSQHLVGIMNQSFAMGPAWTLMRSISAHLDTEALEKTLRQASSPKQRDEMEAKIISLRREETEAMMRSLDLWCGEPDFEEELRLAILGVVEQFRGREEQRDTGSNRGRGREARRVQVNPNSTAEAEAVLDGLKL